MCRTRHGLIRLIHLLTHSPTHTPTESEREEETVVEPPAVQMSAPAVEMSAEEREDREALITRIHNELSYNHFIDDIIIWEDLLENANPGKNKNIFFLYPCLRF